MRLPVKLCSATLLGSWLSMLAACGGGGDASPRPDTTPPSVTATATVGAEAVVLSASASDNVAVTQVDFVIDGGASTATVTDSRGRGVFSTSLPIGGMKPGSHAMVARARDAAGNTADAGAVSFTVGAAAAPPSPVTVTASSTKDGANVTFTIDIQSPMRIALTNFFIDGEFVGGQATDQRQYSFSRPLAPGSHRLLVDVTDVSGNNAQTSLVVDI